MGEGVREMPTLLNKIPKFYSIRLLTRGKGVQKGPNKYMLAQYVNGPL